MLLSRLKMRQCSKKVESERSRSRLVLNREPRPPWPAFAAGWGNLPLTQDESTSKEPQSKCSVAGLELASAWGVIPPRIDARFWGTLLNTDSLPLSQAARCFPRRTETHSQRTHRRTGRFKGSRPSGNSQLCLVFVFTLCFVTTQLQLPCLQGFPPCLYVCFCKRAGRVSFASALVNFLHLPLSLSLNPKSAHVSACGSREQRAHGQRTGQAAGTRPTQHQAQARQQPAQTQDPWRQPWTMACGLAGCPPASTAGGCGAGSRGGGGRRASTEPAATSPCAVDRGRTGRCCCGSSRRRSGTLRGAS